MRLGSGEQVAVAVRAPEGSLIQREQRLVRLADDRADHAEARGVRQGHGMDHDALAFQRLGQVRQRTLVVFNKDR